MNQKINYLNLPKLSTDLQDLLINYGLNFSVDENISNSFELFRNKGLEIVGFNTDKLPINIEQQLHDIYDRYFPNESITFFMQRSNSLSGLPSTLPPHCDSYRKTAINYIILDGGEHSRINFFKQVRSDQTNLESAELCLNENLDFDCSFNIKKNVWHSYDVQTYHSVEGIEQNRLLLSLVLTDTNPDIEVFCSKYKNLIINI